VAREVNTVRSILRSLSKTGDARTTSYLYNIAHLLSGNVLSNGSALISLAIAARALDTEAFGILVLVVTYVRLIERLVRFESWQPLIRFASDLELGSRDKLPRLYLYGLLLDLAAALCSAVLAVLLAHAAGYLLGFGEQHVQLVAIHSVCLLFSISGAPTAALRMAGRFKLMAYAQPIGPVVRAPLAILCWIFWPSLTGFVVAWTIAQITGAIVYIALGWRALAAQSIANPFKQSPRHLARDFPGFVSFAWTTNLSMSLRTMTQEADVLLVGAMAGPSSAGFYHVAKRLAKIAQQVGAQTQAVLYPDMARFWAQGHVADLRRLTLRVQFALGAIGIGTIIAALMAGQPLVELALGSEFRDVGALLVAQLVSVVFIMHAAPARSVLLSMGRPGVVLTSTLCSTVLFFVCAVLLIPRIGAMGASLANIAFAGTTAVWMDLVWLHVVRVHSPKSELS
jgi:O-antigen/teichoic acid export membrane protein